MTDCELDRARNSEGGMTEEDRHKFRNAALEYLRDSDAVIETHIQARIADELERLVSELAEARAIVARLVPQNFYECNTK